MVKSKVTFLTAEEAAKLIEDGSTVAVGGFIGTGVAEEIHMAVEKRYMEKKEPRQLTLAYAGGIGDRATRGLNHYGH